MQSCSTSHQQHRPAPAPGLRLLSCWLGNSCCYCLGWREGKKVLIASELFRKASWHLWQSVIGRLPGAAYQRCTRVMLSVPLLPLHNARARGQGPGPGYGSASSLWVQTNPDTLIVHSNTATHSSTTSGPASSRDEAGVDPAVPGKKSLGFLHSSEAGDRSPIPSASAFPLSSSARRNVWKENRAPPSDFTSSSV